MVAATVDGMTAWEDEVSQAARLMREQHGPDPFWQALAGLLDNEAGNCPEASLSPEEWARRPRRANPAILVARAYADMAKDGRHAAITHGDHGRLTTPGR